MRRLVAATAVLALAGCGAGGASDGDFEGQSARRHQTQVFLAGTNEAGTVRADFSIPNHTDRILHVMDITASCTCSEARIDDRELQPGEEATLSVFTSLSDWPQVRVIECSLVMDDTNDPVQSYSATFRVIPRLEAADPIIRIGKVDPQIPVREHFALILRTPIDQSPNAVVVKPFGLPGAQIKVLGRKRQSVIGSIVEQLLEYELIAPAGSLVDQNDAEIVASVKEAQDVAPVRIPVRWTCKHPVKATPKLVVVSLLETGEAARREVIVTTDNGSPLQVLGVRLEDLPGLSATTERLDYASVAIRVAATPEAQTARHRFAGRLVVRYRADDTVGRFTIPVVVLTPNSD